MTAARRRLKVVAYCLICGGEARTTGGPAVLVHDPQCPEVSLSDAAALARELLAGDTYEPRELARLVIEADRKVAAWITDRARARPPGRAAAILTTPTGRPRCQHRMTHNGRQCTLPAGHYRGAPGEPGTPHTDKENPA